MPVDPGRADQFQDTAGQSDAEILAKSQMQISLAVGTGVLVIVITTLVALVFSQEGRPLGPPVSGKFPTSFFIPETLPGPTTAGATPQPTGTAVIPGQPNPTIATTTPPAATAGPTPDVPPTIMIQSLSCLSNSLTVGDFTTCTVILTSAPLSQLVVEVHRPGPEITAPDTLTFPTGVAQMSFQPLAQPLPDGVPSVTVRLTARVNGSSDHVDITVSGET